MTQSMRELIGDLRRAGGGAGAKAAKVVRKTAMDVEATAKTLVPVDTGNLRSSISTDILGDGRFREMTAEVGPTAEYGAYVEYGTSRHAPQPYMEPALDRHAEAFEQAIAHIIDELL